MICCNYKNGNYRIKEYCNIVKKYLKTYLKFGFIVILNLYVGINFENIKDLSCFVNSLFFYIFIDIILYLPLTILLITNKVIFYCVFKQFLAC